MNVNCAFSIKSIVLDPDIMSLEDFFLINMLNAK